MAPLYSSWVGGMNTQLFFVSLNGRNSSQKKRKVNVHPIRETQLFTIVITVAAVLLRFVHRNYGFSSLFQVAPNENKKNGDDSFCWAATTNVIALLEINCYQRVQRDADAEAWSCVSVSDFSSFLFLFFTAQYSYKYIPLIAQVLTQYEM